jgi:predicted MPP superfamily phosphohydrolase
MIHFNEKGGFIMFSFIVAGLLFAIVYFTLNIYVAWHGLLLLDLSGLRSWEWLYWIVVSFVAFAYILTRMPFVRGRAQHILQWIGSWYMGVFYFSILLLPLMDGLYWVMTHFVFADSKVTILSLTVFYTLILSILLARGYWNARTPIVRKHEISLAVSDKNFDSLANPQPITKQEKTCLKVIVASDLHLGHLVNRNQLQKLLAIVNQSQPDLILLPGDVVDDDPHAFVETGMSEIMREIAAIARLGCYAVLGNHEYYGRQIEQYVKIMSSVGVQVLRDEYVVIEHEQHIAGPLFYLVGRKDFTAEQFARSGVGQGRLSVKNLLAQLPQDIPNKIPVVMMDHQPRRFDLAVEAGVNLLLCGHTHRGQFAPNHLLTRRLFELDWGYLKKDTMHVLVSSGFGTWGPPLRLASRSEVLELILEFG